MEITNKCEFCSMDATYQKKDEQGLAHYYCSHHKPSGAVKTSEFKPISSFTPLIVIFILIILFTIISLVYHGSWDFMYAIRHFEGAFFVIFGGFKLLNLKGFSDAYSNYDILAKRSKIYSYVYPFIEIALGVAYLASFYLLATGIVTFFIMTIGTIGVAKEIAKKNEVPCACLGVVFKIPMTKVTLLEDILMGIMALIMTIKLF